MYTGLLHTHNMFRWLVLIVIVLAVVFCFHGLVQKTRLDKKRQHYRIDSDHFYGHSVFGWNNFICIRQSVNQSRIQRFWRCHEKLCILRFYAVEHILLMIIALVLVHIGRSKIEKSSCTLEKTPCSSHLLRDCIIADFSRNSLGQSIDIVSIFPTFPKGEGVRKYSKRITMNREDPLFYFNC
jgi:hypothetical protein